MTSIESEARGISERHFEMKSNPFHWCEGCGSHWPCPDRLAADAITQKIEEAVRQLEAIDTPNDRVVAALASLQGDKTDAD